MEQTRVRSLTESEMAAEQAIFVLKLLKFVPTKSHNSVLWNSIKRIKFEQNESNYVTHEILERSVAFKWESGPEVRLILRQGRGHASTINNCALPEEKNGYYWTVESMEIVNIKEVWSFEERGLRYVVGKIVFDNRAAVEVMEDAAKLR